MDILISMSLEHACLDLVNRLVKLVYPVQLQSTSLALSYWLLAALSIYTQQEAQSHFAQPVTAEWIMYAKTVG